MVYRILNIHPVNFRKTIRNLIYIYVFFGYYLFQQNDHDNYACKLFLGGLSPNTTEESITNFYAQYGEVANAVVKRDPTTQRSKGFGFITYKDSSSIERAQSLKPHIIDGR